MRNLYQYRKEYQMILEDMALSMFRKNLLSFEKSGILDKKVDPEELNFTKSHLPDINDAIKSVQSSDKLRELIGPGDDYLNDKKQYKPESLYKVIEFYKKSQEFSNLKDKSNTDFVTYNIPDTDIVVFMPFNAEANRYLAHSVLTRQGQPVPTWCIAASGGRRYWNQYKLSDQEYPPVFIFCRKSGIGDKYDDNKYEVVFTHLSTENFIENDKDSRFTASYEIEWRNPEQNESAHFFGYSNNFKNTFPEIAGPEINSIFRKLMQKYKPNWDKIRKKRNKKSIDTFSSGNLSVKSLANIDPQTNKFYIKPIIGKISPLDVVKVITSLSKYNFILIETEWETIYERLSFDEFIYLVKWIISNRSTAKLYLRQILSLFDPHGGKYELRNYFETHEKFKKLLIKAALQFSPDWRYLQNIVTLKQLAADKLITPETAAEKWVNIRERPRDKDFIDSFDVQQINNLINLYYTDNNLSTKKFAENCLLKIQEISAPISSRWVVDTFTLLKVKPTDKFGKMVIKSIMRYTAANLYQPAGIIGPFYGSPIFWRRYNNLESWRKNAIDTVFYNYIKKHLDIFNDWPQYFSYNFYETYDFKKVLKEHSPKLYELYEIFLNKYDGNVAEPAKKIVKKEIKTTPLAIIKKEIKNDNLTISSLNRVTNIDSKTTLKICNFLLTAPIDYDRQPIDIKQMYGWVLLSVRKIIQKKLLSGKSVEKTLSLIYDFFDNNYQDLKWIPFDVRLDEEFAHKLITHVLTQFIKQQKIDINFIDTLLSAIRHGDFQWDLATLLTKFDGLPALLYKKYNISDLPPNEANMIKQAALS